MPLFDDIKAFILADFVLTITLALSVFLAIISLFSGWRRKDFMVFAKPRAFTTIGLGILFSLILRFLERSTFANFSLDFLPINNIFLGISHLPLIILAIAYGPSVALFSTALFIAVTTQNYDFNWLDAVLMLELVVLGWWAIYPSSFQKRWAGPINLIITYILVWGTAGTAYFHSQGLDVRDWRTHFNYHQNYIFSLLISVIFLLLIGPKVFSKLFPDSRIIPPVESKEKNAKSSDLILVSDDSLPAHYRIPFSKPTVTSLKRSASRVRSMSPSPDRVAMRSFKDIKESDR